MILKGETRVLSNDGVAMTHIQEGAGTRECGCAGASAPVSASYQDKGPAAVPERNLEDLIPLAIVIAGGCEPCAEKAVTRALEQGASRRHIQKTLDIIAKVRKLDCFAKAIGPDAVARMERPLAAGRRTLRKATLSAGT
jgi:hypothetical protein